MNINWPKFPFRLIPGYQSLGFSLSQLDKAYAQGSIAELEYRWRVLFWTWGAARFEGHAGRLQDRCYDAFGLEGVDRRIGRVRKLRGRYIRKHYGEWLIE
jgi:hypothetical protein